MEKQVRKINANRTYIYVEDCAFCGHTEGYAKVATRLKLNKKDVFVKQTPLFLGWQQEAAALGLEMPSVYDCDTNQKATVAELEEMSDEELEAWLDNGKQEPSV